MFMQSRAVFKEENGYRFNFPPPEMSEKFSHCKNVQRDSAWPEAFEIPGEAI